MQPEVTVSDSGTSEKRPLPVEEVIHNMPATSKKITCLTTVACDSRATRAPLRPPRCRFMFQSTAAKQVRYSWHVVPPQESRPRACSHSHLTATWGRSGRTSYRVGDDKDMNLTQAELFPGEFAPLCPDSCLLANCLWGSIAHVQSAGSFYKLYSDLRL